MLMQKRFAPLAAACVSGLLPRRSTSCRRSVRNASSLARKINLSSQITRCDSVPSLIKHAEATQESELLFSFASLNAEVEDLRKEPPIYISRVGQLTQPSLLCDDDGNLKKPTGDGPWDLTAYVTGAEGDDAYGHPFRVSLRFDDTWPQNPCEVRFQCVFHHMLLKEGSRMRPEFYQALPKDDRGRHTVAAVLSAIHKFLVDPLDGWVLPPGFHVARLSLALQHSRAENAKRMSIIERYSKLCLHADLFSSVPRWKQEWFDPAFVAAMASNTSEDWKAILTEHLPNEIYSFRLFTDEFCDMLLAEIFNFYDSKLPAQRPNSMNNYGIILNEIGLEPMIDELQKILQPLGRIMFPGAGEMWDGHHCFIVRYREGEDLGLDMHTDDSDVTFNVCLGLEFEGAGLQFCGLMGAGDHRKQTYLYQHRKGHVVFHLGRKRHGADDITSGERLNLILWNHSSTYRQSAEYQEPNYASEEGPPDAVCVSYTHDRDYGNYKRYPQGKEHFRGHGWCPPRAFQYDGFKPDHQSQSSM